LPRLWEEYINRILIDKMGFHITVHERSIYCGFVNSHRILIKRQVDDIAVAAPNAEIASEVINMIGQHVTIQGNHVLTKFNGVKVDQMSTYIKLHCQSYIDKVLLNHGWDTPSSVDNSIREPLSSSLIKSIDTERWESVNPVNFDNSIFWH
jgi:Reverse transcriptase (RNA-dependent DNA polymerase)